MVNLVRAHRQLDTAVDAAYARTAFAGDRDRAALLFARYRALAAGRADFSATVTESSSHREPVSP